MRMVIAFIEPWKFNSLMDRYCDLAVNRDHSQVLYANSSGVEICELSQEKFSSSVYIVIPDSHNIDNLVLNHEFKMLYHSGTLTRVDKMALRSSQQCAGYIESLEEDGTIYDKIAKDICNLNNGSESIFNEIWQAIPDKSQINELAYDFLHKLTVELVRGIRNDYNNQDLLVLKYLECETEVLRRIRGITDVSAESVCDLRQFVEAKLN